MVIPEAVIEAAALAVFTQAYERADWDLITNQIKSIYMRDARLGLEAAAPHIAAQALEEAAYAFEGLPMNKGASIGSGTYDWFELFPIQHIRDRAEDLRK